MSFLAGKKKLQKEHWCDRGFNYTTSTVYACVSGVYLRSVLFPPLSSKYMFISTNVRNVCQSTSMYKRLRLEKDREFCSFLSVTNTAFC